MKKGFFLTFEGVEGCGKTTQVDLLQKALTDKGYDCVTTREPGGTRIGNRVRELLLDSGFGEFDSMAELLLYEACRAQLVGEFILPSIKAGKIVLCDRFTDSTLAYQGTARGLDSEMISGLNEIASRGIVPDRTIFLDLEPKDGLARARTRNQASLEIADESRFENESLVFHAKVRDGFMAIAEREPGRFKVISAYGSVGEVHERVVQEVTSILSKKPPLC